MAILITGGAGFIGRHTAKLACAAGYDVVVLDNLSTGRRKDARYGALVEGDIADTILVRRLIRERSITAVIHLAASAHVGDSMARPGEYYANNVCGTASLLEAATAEGVRKLVFASSCSVYGNAASSAAREDEPVIPMSPYGESKLVTERALGWYERAHGLKWVALRYFNVAGAEDALGEDVAGCRRIVPRAVHAAIGGGAPLQIFGGNFETADGSAVRDYVHVGDVARANLCALRYVEQARPAAVINIGSGNGVSVLEIVREVERQTGRPVAHRIEAARAGDPGCAVSDARRAQHLLGWRPERSSIGEIVASVLRSRELREQPRKAAGRRTVQVPVENVAAAWSPVALPLH
jgi:UDP-glucose-4-epimerase GalE